MIKLIGKLVVWGLLAVVMGVVNLGGYFYYKAGQPMQVAAAQRLAPGITYRQFWADRVQQWREIDDQKEAQGKGRACVITGRVTFTYWLWGSIVNVARVHNQPGTPRAKAIIAGVNGIIPPDELVYGPGGNCQMPGGGKLRICLGISLTDHLLGPGIVKLVRQTGRPSSKQF